MAEPKGLPCPECGAPREPDNTPVCGCGRRAADALRDARTAEAAAAEDFDPLRIRPYVSVGEALAPDDPPTRHLPGAGGAPAPPDAPPPATPAPADEGHGDGPPRGRRRLLLLAAAGGVVAVAAATGYASGMFSYDRPVRNAALPSDLRASVPDGAVGGAGPSAPPTAPRPAAPPDPSADPSATASPGPSSSASASPSPSGRTGEPSAPSASASATGSATPVPGDVRSAGAVLRRGDRGPEVTELQLRLHELDLYGNAADGHFTRPLENALRGYQWSRGVDTDPDELGVYGPDTRRSLEAETREP